MGSLAATKLRPEFHRQGSATTSPFYDPVVSLENVAMHSDERTRLLFPSTEPALPATNHDLRAWLHFLLNQLRLFPVSLSSTLINVLLLFVPMGLVAGAVGANPTIVFILNFLAIIPLASILSVATEGLSANLGPTIGGLLNATFGNAVELIVSPITWYFSALKS